MLVIVTVMPDSQILPSLWMLSSPSINRPTFQEVSHHWPSKCFQRKFQVFHPKKKQTNPANNNNLRTKMGPLAASSSQQAVLRWRQRLKRLGRPSTWPACFLAVVCSCLLVWPCHLPCWLATTATAVVEESVEIFSSLVDVCFGTPAGQGWFYDDDDDDDALVTLRVQYVV